MDIKIKYHDDKMPRLKQIEKGNWIDLCVVDILGAEEEIFYDERMVCRFRLDADERYKINLGISMELPKGYEAYMLPRSSTFGETGILLTNSMGIIDCSYNGDDDIWKASVYTTRDTIVNKYSRLFQFRIQEVMPKINFQVVSRLGNKNRGGFGSTGR